MAAASTRPLIVADEQTAELASRLVAADKTAALLGEASAVLGRVGGCRGDRRTCACEVCGLRRRITWHLGRLA